MFLPESGAPCPPFPYVTLGVPPSRSIRTLSRVVLLSGTAEPGTCPPPLLHHVCLYSFSLSLSQFQSTESTLLNMSDEEETDYSQTEGESEQSEEEVEDDVDDEEDSDEDDEDDVDDEEDEDLPHLDGYLEGYNRGYRDALRENYPSDDSQTEGESEQSEEESDYGEEEVGDGEDQDQTEPESEEEYQVERPHSPDTCRRRCKTRCRFPVRS